MQIPMEVLPQMVVRADSDTGGRQASGRAARNTQFGEMFETAMQGTQQWARPRQRQASSAGTNTEASAETNVTENNVTETRREETPEKACLPEEDIAEEKAIVLGNTNEVVFVLEGDKESATTPEMRVETEVDAGEVQELPEQTEVKLAKEQEMPGKHVTETKNFETALSEAVKDTAAAEQSKAPEATYAQSSETKNAEATIKQELANAAADGEAQGEVTARTPTIRTSEQQGNDGGNTSFSNRGGLSPLENENDTVQVKGQSQSTFAEAVETVRDKAEDMAYQASAPPLSEGIKPEQFKAAQQMKQAAFDAPVSPENLFDTMIARLEAAQTQTQQTMTIHLRPEFLGKVALELAMDASGLHVKISAADSGVRAMINGQITALIESLENKGIEVVEVEVAYTGVDNGAAKESRQNNTPQENNKRRLRREVDRADSIVYYTANQLEAIDYYLEAGVSSVEYSA